MTSIRSALGIALCALPLAALAGHQECAGRKVDAGVRRCADGSPPLFVADTIQPAGGRAEPERAPAQAGGGAQDLFGVWHTNVAGGVWETPSQVPGWNTLHVSPGVRAGDLTIDPGGKYVWNSYGGKAGDWVRGDAAYPIVLIDRAETRNGQPKRWKIGFDRTGKGIYIWDGNFTYAGKR